MHPLLVLSILFATRATVAPADSALARALRWAALDQRAALDLDSALVLLQAARRADPSYFPAQLDYIQLRHARYEHAVLAREAVELAKSKEPGERCLALAMSQFTEYRNILPDLLAMSRRGRE